MLVTDYIVQFSEQRLKNVFGVSGANIEELFYRFGKSSVKPILAKTEYQAALMAVGSYLATQKIHVVLTTSGAGVLNTLPVLAEAYASRHPLVLISGLPPSHLEGLGGFQDTSSLNGSLHLEAIMKPTVSFIQKISQASDLPQALTAAWSIAETEKRPVVLLINKNVFSQSVEHAEISALEISSPANNDLSDLKNAFSQINEKPFFIFGEELVHLKDTSCLEKLVTKYDAFVATTPQAKGFFNHRDSRFVGLIGMMGSSLTTETLKKSKDIVIIGSRMDHLSRFGLDEHFKEKNIIHLSYFNEKPFLETSFSFQQDLQQAIQELL